ncbi:Sds3-like-domain-containing protein, partial [Jimgerdemannia flammicorona]
PPHPTPRHSPPSLLVFSYCLRSNGPFHLDVTHTTPQPPLNTPTPKLSNVSYRSRVRSQKASASSQTMELESHPTVTHPGSSSLAHDLPSPKPDTHSTKSHADRVDRHDPPTKLTEPVVTSAGTSRVKKEAALAKKNADKEDDRDGNKKPKPVDSMELEHDPNNARPTVRHDPEPSKGKRSLSRQEKLRERESAAAAVLATTTADRTATKPPTSKPEEPPDAELPSSPLDRVDAGADVDDTVFDDDALSNTSPREDAPHDPEEDELKSHAHSTASSLSSVPDDFPLSRSVSPSPAMPERKRKRDEDAMEAEDASGENEGGGTEDENDGEEEEAVASLEEEGSVDDDDEYQRRHREALQALTQIEIEFAKLRDKMYHEKLAELDQEVVMINNGKHQTFLHIQSLSSEILHEKLDWTGPFCHFHSYLPSNAYAGTHPELAAFMAEIEEKRRKRLETADAWKRYQQWSYQRQYEGFEYQANVHFVSEKSSLRRELISNLSAKQWKLEEEHNLLNEIIPSQQNSAPPDRPAMLRHKKVQKVEAGELKNIQETVGFPVAPHVQGLAKKDMDEDFESLGLARVMPPPRVQARHHTSRTDRQGHHPVGADGIYTQAGALQYNGHWFKKGDTVIVVDASAGRFTAKMVLANESEVGLSGSW